MCLHRCHNAGMKVQITIRDVPRKVKDELAARAALRGKSMQEYLRGELERLAARLQIEMLMQRIQQRKATTGTRLSSSAKHATLCRSGVDATLR